MASRTKNITIDQGTDYQETFSPYLTPGSTSTIELNGNYSADAQIRKSTIHTDSVLTFTTSISHAGTETDTVILSANNIQTSKVKAGKYLYEIVLTDGNLNPPQKTRIIEGIATVAPSVEVGSMYTINSTGHDVRSSYT